MAFPAALGGFHRWTAPPLRAPLFCRVKYGVQAMHRYIMTVRCPDRPGIVHGFSEALLHANANILENAQFGDDLTRSFCMRTRFETPLADIDIVEAHLQPAADGFDAEMSIKSEATTPRMLIMVSKFDHCLVDLLYRWNAGDLPIEVVGVVSNHEDCRSIVERYGLSYHHIAVTPESKAEAEAALLVLVEQSGADLVVLARYMQVLSDDLCRALRGKAINIHHSFLPGFKGARPYHQAHARGVKLIGATAHYVTADLDEGPIIEQDVVRVGHVESAERLAAVGRDVERRVLSHAVRVHAERRVFLSGSRTVVF